MFETPSVLQNFVTSIPSDGDAQSEAAKRLTQRQLSGEERGAVRQLSKTDGGRIAPGYEHVMLVATQSV